jgi:hypothetical protein
MKFRKTDMVGKLLSSAGIILIFFGIFCMIGVIFIWSEYAWAEPRVRESYRLFPEQIPEILNVYVTNAVNFLISSLALLAVGSLFLAYHKKRENRSLAAL